MNICYKFQSTLPMLAWCARINNDCGTVTVFHGRGVETFPEAFVEGAWDGAFAERAFGDATIFAGTGALVSKDTVSFYAGSGRLNPLFRVVDANSVTISNSLFFVMVQAGVEPNDHYPFYNYDLIEIWRQGFFGHSGRLRMKSGQSVYVQFCGILNVNRFCEMTFGALPESSPPEDYSSYRRMMVEGVRRVIDNAADTNRRMSYRPLATMSKGYDSTATTILAHAAGCRDVITYTDSHEADPFSDSGKDNATTLGMKCLEADRWAYLDIAGRSEPEFAFLALACMAPLAVFEGQLAGKILVVGNFGDTIWDRNESAACDHFSLTWSSLISGLSHLEFRLRVGYLMFPPTYIGARHNRAIHRISNSDEMRAWTVEGRYNRAIPRRIAEEAGIPNDKINPRKEAKASVNLISSDLFSKEGLADYLRFVTRHDAELTWITLLFWRACIAGRHALWSLLGAKRERHVRTSWFQRSFPFIFNRQPLRICRPFCYTLQWSYDCLRTRYRADGSRGTGVVEG